MPCMHLHAQAAVVPALLRHASPMMMQFRDNLAARLQLLGQLHMKLPDDLNAAEQRLRDGDLPELDQQAQLLKKQIKVVAAQHIM